MKNNLIGLTVALTVGIILVGSLVVPTITAFTDETRTYTNEGMPFAEVDEDTHTILVTSSGISVDGESLDLSLLPGSFTSYTLVYGENSLIRYTTNDVYIQATVMGQIPVRFNYTEGDVTISITGAAVTVTTTADSTTVSLSDAKYYISTSGDYVMSLNPCVTAESEIIGAGYTSFSTPNTMIATAWSGTIENISATVLRTTNGDAVVSDTTVNTSAVDGDLVHIDSVLIDYVVTYQGTDYECTSTYTYFLAPASVTYDNPDYLGAGPAAILGAVIVVTLVSFVVIASKGFGRDD